MADVNQVINLINQIAALGIEFLPEAIALGKRWQTSSGQSITELANSSDAQIDEAVLKVLQDEADMGFSTPPTASS